MAAERITKTQLSNWFYTYVDSKAEDRETNWVVFTKEELVALLNEMEKTRAGSARAYLVRQDDFKNSSGEGRDILKNGHTQISLVLTPAADFGGKDKFDNNHEIFAIFPGNRSSEHTGLCPVHCGEEVGRI